MIVVHCEYCGQPFKRRNSRDVSRFCSKACQSRGIIAANPHPAQVLAAMPLAPDTCTRQHISEVTGLSKGILARTLTALRLSGRATRINMTQWQQTGVDASPLTHKLHIPDTPYRTTLAPGAPWPYRKRARA